MANLSPVFNEILQQRNAASIGTHPYTLERINEFLKEAYQINHRAAELLSYLRTIRQPYLYDAPPPRRRHLDQSRLKENQYLTDTQKDQIDGEAKGVLRELHAAVNNLSRAEQVRQDTETAITQKRRMRNGFGILGNWAAGGAVSSKGPEEQAEEARANGVKAHREGVIWFLQRRLEHCGAFQSSMMEIRLKREIEKSKSALYKARGSGPMPVWDDSNSSGIEQTRSGMKSSNSKNSRIPLNELEGNGDQTQEDEEQLHLLAQENQGLIKHYENKLDQVRAAEHSLVEISELQSTLAANLEIQSAHIDQLIQDSFLTATNVQSGNKQLKRATERKSTAKWVFRGTVGACVFFVLWDFII